MTSLDRDIDIGIAPDRPTQQLAQSIGRPTHPLEARDVGEDYVKALGGVLGWWGDNR